MNKFRHNIRTTLAINPETSSAQISRGRWESFSFAVAGLLHMLRYAKNIRIQVLATVVVGLVGLWVGLSALEWAVIVLIIAMNWLAEFLNAAIEAVVNLASPEYHDMARLAKDIAAGAVLLATISAVIIAGLILVPPLWERLA